MPPDVVEILGRQRNATAYICDAVRAYRNAPAVSGMELQVSIASCRCGRDYVIANDVGSCPSGCDRSAAKIDDAGTLTIK
jgi:hypothetical protein